MIRQLLALFISFSLGHASVAGPANMYKKNARAAAKKVRTIKNIQGFHDAFKSSYTSKAKKFFKKKLKGIGSKAVLVQVQSTYKWQVKAAAKHSLLNFPSIRSLG